MRQKCSTTVRTLGVPKVLAIAKSLGRALLAALTKPLRVLALTGDDP